MGNEFYHDLLSRLRDGRSAVLLTKWRNAEGGVETELTKQLLEERDCDGIALEALEKGLPVIKGREEGMVLAEPFYPQERLIVLGGGHIALSLTEFAAKVGFSVTVVDDRPYFANFKRFPWADQVVCDAFENAIEALGITRNDYVAILTRGHRYDQVCLERLLNGTEPFYTGMIGSRRRVSAVMGLLREKGCDDARLGRIHTPIGLAIGAATPEEIAVSILAELISCKRLNGTDKIAGDHHPNRSEMDFEVLEALAANTEPVAAVTVIAAKGSVPRGAGAKMLVYPDGRITGSIGGGCSEASVIGSARSIIGTGGYRLQTVDMTGEAAEDEGMVCGGVIQVLIEDIKDSKDSSPVSVK